MDHSYSVEWGPVILFPLTQETSEGYRQLRNMESIRRWFASRSEISGQQQKEWFQSYLKDESDIMFSIHLNDSVKTFVGANAVYHISRSKKEGEYGRIAIKPEFAGKGIGYAATMAVCTFAGRDLGLESLVLEVYQSNVVAVKVYEKAGFRHLPCYQHSINEKGMMRMIKKL